MQPVALLGDPSRLAELQRLDILETGAEPAFDDLAVLASALVRSPIAAVNFVDDRRHFTKAVVGLDGARGGSVPNEVSFCAATVQEPDGVLVVPDTRADARWSDHPLVVGGPRVGFYAGAAIVSRGERVGVVCAFGSEPRPVDATQLQGLVTLARQAADQLELRRRNAELRELAVSDPLTGLANRTLLMDRLRLALREATREGGTVGVLFCDVDDFKGVNDTHGHEVGDRVLCDVARRLSAEVRAVDTVARIAGDEFVVVCPGLDDEGLETMRDRLARPTGRPLPGGAPGPGISIGAVVARPGDRAPDVLRLADEGMYAHKRRRRG